MCEAYGNTDRSKEMAKAARPAKKGPDIVPADEALALLLAVELLKAEPLVEVVFLAVVAFLDDPAVEFISFWPEAAVVGAGVVPLGLTPKVPEVAYT